MTDYKAYFKGKRITVMGLGLLGRGLGYTKFLAECGADLTVTDLKTKEQLATSLKALSKYKNIKYVLGEHRIENFQNKDMIIKAAGVPLDSVYIEEAKKNNIPVEMDVSLFAKLVPEVMIIGVTGTRGKSMTTMLIYEFLSKGIKNKNVYLGGNVRGVATLPLLKKVKAGLPAQAGGILVCELDSWQLQGFREAKISPHISVFTSFMPDHMNYYKGSMEKYFADKANIFKCQKSGDYLIIRPGMKEYIKKENAKGSFFVINKSSVEDLEFIVPGDFQRENLACAVTVAEILGIDKEKIKSIIKKFKGVEGRLQYLRTYKGIKIYNDNNATTPEAVMAGISALRSGDKNIILICGGADKKLDLTNFVNTLNKDCKAVSLIPGTGTDVLLKDYKLEIPNEVGKDFKQAVLNALKFAKKGDTILFSPAFASFGLFNNEYERNDLFMKIIKNLK